MQIVTKSTYVTVASSQPAVVPLEYTQHPRDTVTREEQFEQNFVESMREGVEKLGRRYVQLIHKIQGLMGEGNPVISKRTQIRSLLTDTHARDTKY